MITRIYKKEIHNTYKYNLDLESILLQYEKKLINEKVNTILQHQFIIPQQNLIWALFSIIADFFARFKKISGNDVYFLTGTDEHGQKIERAAKQNNKEPLTFVMKLAKNFKNLSKTLNLSNNDFIRTTEERHKKSVECIWKIRRK